MQKFIYKNKTQCISANQSEFSLNHPTSQKKTVSSSRLFEKAIPCPTQKYKRRIPILKSDNPQNRETLKRTPPIATYFRTTKKPDLSTFIFENNLADLLFKKQFIDLDKFAANEENQNESLDINKLNEQSIHFSKLEDSNSLEKETSKVLFDKLNFNNTYFEETKQKSKKSFIFNVLNELREKIVEAHLTFDCQLKCFDFVNKIKKTINEENVPTNKTSFRELLKFGTAKKKTCFR